MEKVIDVSRVSEKMIVIKVLVQGIIVSVISVYTPQCGFDDSQKDNFYGNLMSFTSKFGKKEVAIVAGDVSGFL